MKKAILRKNGFVLPLITCAMILLFTISLGLLQLSYNSRLMAARESSRMVARCAADAGITKAIYEMNKKLQVKPWDGSSLPQATKQTLPNSDAVFSYRITGTDPDSYQIESTGTYNLATKTITCSVKPHGLFDPAILANTTLMLENKAAVDWYNYGDEDFPLQIASNSTAAGAITLLHSSKVSGDAVVGVDGNPTTAIDAPWANITGDRYAQTEQYKMLYFTIPAEMEDLPYSPSITTTKTINSSGKYDGITLNHKDTVTFSGNMTIYCINDVELDQSAQIVINGNVTMYVKGSLLLRNSSQLKIVDYQTNPNASLNLYVGNTLETRNQSDITNDTKDPRRLHIYGLGTCIAISLTNTSTFYGTIYAPTANVIFSNQHETYGAVVAGTFTQKNTSAFWYDASLRNADISDQGVEFAVQRWEEL